jgi:hypothetical protein
LDAVEVALGEWARIHLPGRTVVDLMRMRERFLARLEVSG